MRDGFWVLDWVHRMNEVRSTPIIVVSGDPPEKSKARALACGAAAYFQKPVDKRELTATVARLLPCERASAPLAPIV